MRRQALGALAMILAGAWEPASARAAAPPPSAASPAPPPAAPPPTAPAPAPPPAAPTAVKAPPAPWGLVYQRSCHDSHTAPVLSVDGLRVASCGAVFEVSKGRFVSHTQTGLLAFLPGDRLLVNDYGDAGPTVVGPQGQNAVHSSSGGSPEIAAVSPDGGQVVSFEIKSGARTLVVRQLPSLKLVRSTSLGKDSNATTAVGMLADGREVVLADHGCVEEKCKAPAARSCRQTRCAGRAILTVERGALVPLIPGVKAAAFGARGDLAAIVRKDGSAAVVALPDGQEIARLPRQDPDKEISAIAVSPAGDRVAIAVEGDTGQTPSGRVTMGAGKLTVLAVRSDATTVEVLATPRFFTRSLRFAADGRTLFAGDDLGVYREGALARPQTPLSYTVTLPKGFVALERAGGEWRVHGKDDQSWSARDEAVAMYYHQKLGTKVTVSEIDPEESGREGDAEAWALRVAARAFPHLPLATAKDRAHASFRAWGDAEHGRAVEIHWRSVGGCDEEVGYARVAEREGRTTLVRIEVPGDLKPARAVPLLQAFFDAPLGVHPGRPPADSAVARNAGRPPVAERSHRKKHHGGARPRSKAKKPRRHKA